MTYEIYMYGEALFLTDELTREERAHFEAQGAKWLASALHMSPGKAQLWFVDHAQRVLGIPVELEDEDIIYDN